MQVPDAVPGAVRRHQLDGVLPAAALLHFAVRHRAAQDGGLLEEICAVVPAAERCKFMCLCWVVYMN
jgi:hypothetical protein